MLTFLNKIWNNIKLFFYYVSVGMVSADRMITGTEGISDGTDGTVNEAHNEQDSVYKDLLRGEVTQEVKELRHEMYYAERESHKYKYDGNGGAEKKNNVFTDFVEGVENSEMMPVILIQDNYSFPKKTRLQSAESSDDIDGTEWTIKPSFNFNPRFKLERYLEKVVVKKGHDADTMILDMYYSKYESQFDRRHKPFLNELENMMEGVTIPDIQSIESLSFVTHKAFGYDDLVEFSFNNFRYIGIVKYEGSYVVKFRVNMEKCHDIVSEFFDENAAKKEEAHAPRKKATTMDFSAAAVSVKKDEDKSVSEVDRLVNIFGG